MSSREGSAVVGVYFPRRTLGLVLLSMIALDSACAATAADSKGKTMHIDTLNDTVMQFQTEGRFVILNFTNLAGTYRLSVEREDFVQQMGVLAWSFKTRKPARLVLDGMDLIGCSTT